MITPEVKVRVTCFPRPPGLGGELRGMKMASRGPIFLRNPWDPACHATDARRTLQCPRATLRDRCSDVVSGYLEFAA